MAKQKPKTTTAGLKKQPDSKVNIIYLILLIAYGFITVLTPNSKALDSNGPKFLALAVLNLVCFIYLFSRKDVKSHTGNYFAFFSNGIGIAYSGLMIISLLSFFKAINVVESILHFSKIFTTFTAAYLISILFIKDKRNIFYISIAMSFLLIVDSITGFSGIQRYISGKLTNFEDIKSIYSHKNILAAAIFIKIPFALFLMVFSKKAWRILGGIGFLLAVTALFFLSTRAFYLGLFALTILLSIYFIIRFFQTHDKSQLKLMLSSLFIMLFAFMVF